MRRHIIVLFALILALICVTTVQADDPIIMQPQMVYDGTSHQAWIFVNLRATTEILWMNGWTTYEPLMYQAPVLEVGITSFCVRCERYSSVPMPISAWVLAIPIQLPPDGSVGLRTTPLQRE